MVEEDFQVTRMGDNIIKYAQVSSPPADAQALDAQEDGGLYTLVPVNKPPITSFFEVSHTASSTPPLTPFFLPIVVEADFHPSAQVEDPRAN